MYGSWMDNINIKLEDEEIEFIKNKNFETSHPFLTYLKKIRKSIKKYKGE